jgi:hypothetical protein
MKLGPARHTLSRMARDPEQGGAFVFDLIDDDADLQPPLNPSDPGADGGPDDGERGAPPSGGLDSRMRVLAPVAAVLAIALGTGFAVDGVRESARMERMRDAHGGVVDLSSPLAETWAWEGSVGASEALEAGRWTENEVAVLGDLLVFPSDDDLVALDPASGDEAWRLELGDDPDCGPLGSAGWAEAVTRRLVCLTGSGPDRVAMVVGPDGAVSTERALDAADTRRYGEARPGPDGTVLRARRVGPEAGTGDAECDEATGECTGTVDAGQDLALRAEDAVTGAERWSVVVPFRSTPAGVCNNWSGSSWDRGSTWSDQEEMIDPADFSARITSELVQLYGCGVEAAVTPSGVLLGVEIEPGTGSVESLRTGGYSGYTFDDGDRTRSTLYSADGEVVGEAEGYVLLPLAVDGLGPATLMSIGGVPPRSYALDGTLRWEVTAPDVQMFLGQTAGTAIVQAGMGSVRGLDLATGEELWSWDGPKPDEEDGLTGDLYVREAFTDGQTVLLIVENEYGGAAPTVLDAVSGEVVWEQGAHVAGAGEADELWPRPSSGLVAVDGKLVEVAPDGVRGLG